ncbi:hypothetical protein [Metapseudomonas furukawaii]|jgi:hypothetical protein|uniref:hypothetical protein n=1 Tax=Metapseudomonas furukawaii TaxID=1149133 RepID=UPI00056BE9AD|nr:MULTISPECIES: hypothetical protein [Pseudomonas]OWJ92747.1 hypothetical protein B6S59_19480 [Pseudomonas sp. A46]
MSARFSVKRVLRSRPSGDRKNEKSGFEAYWYRIIDKATGNFVGGQHDDESKAASECERLNSRTGFAPARQQAAPQ